MRVLLAILFMVLAALPAAAVNPDEILPDPVLESRAREISSHLRCLVCQNQSIDDSDADLARDLRLIVRERLVAGDSNEQTLQYVVDRYGEFVLLNPVMAPHTFLLWIAAPLVLGLGLVAIIVLAIRRRRTPVVAGVPALSPEEAAALAALDGGPAPVPGKKR